MLLVKKMCVFVVFLGFLHVLRPFTDTFGQNCIFLVISSQAVSDSNCLLFTNSLFYLNLFYLFYFFYFTFPIHNTIIKPESHNTFFFNSNPTETTWKFQLKTEQIESDE